MANSLPCLQKRYKLLGTKDAAENADGHRTGRDIAPDTACLSWREGIYHLSDFWPASGSTPQASPDSPAHITITVPDTFGCSPRRSSSSSSSGITS